MPEYTFETFRPHQLSDTEMAELVWMVREPFIWYAPRSTEEDIYDRLRGSGESYVDVVFVDGHPCGFAVHYAKVCGGYQVSYRGGSAIRTAVRGHGLYRQLVERSLETGHYDYIATRTQNQIVYKTLLGLAVSGLMYPHPDHAPPPHVVEIAQATNEDGVVEPEMLIVRGAHTFVRKDRSFMKLTGDRPGDAEIQRFFSENLGPDDGFMVVVAV